MTEFFDALLMLREFGTEKNLHKNIGEEMSTFELEKRYLMNIKIYY